ncbi:radical SAM family heme chaperone HemW [Helicobacter anatolicus]|uniref:radical SAM family heme chaperone HemW n=1 Tax=Helicobacter anatolicus TaxID=2905874 RepID=UPI001E415313|nr:radical SAM family heme chaperone HemW [Helicobacter anatolicus]MCE3038755.1 radical SAM family heme chaperone HemW [Helicobacter anatolicus]
MILYIHIPFCTSRCGYCTFNSFENKDYLQDAYVSALLADLKTQDNHSLISSIYFGGGTPNTLQELHYEKIFTCIFEHFSIHKDCEITLESNPNLITSSWCNTLKNLGATRLSFGVQSFFEDKLNFLQREHSKKDIYYALEVACNAGFENLSIDLIYDTLLDSKKRLIEEITLAAKLPINHLSAYSLTIEKESKLQKQGIKEISQSFSEFLREKLSLYNFLQYEVSNYSRGYEVKHNLAYWDYQDYIGCGCGGVGKKNYQRFYTHNHLESYIKNPTFRKIENLEKKDILLEKIFLGLRSKIGVDIKLLNPKKLAILTQNHKGYIRNDRFFALDYFLADEIALWLL